MGNNQSESFQTPFIDSNHAYKSMYHNTNEPIELPQPRKIISDSSSGNLPITPKSSDYIPTPLLKTMYHGVWSMHYPESIAPITRVGQCAVFDEKNNTVIIAYGCGPNNKCLNDAWAFNLKTFAWKCLSRSLRGPRQYASAALAHRRMYIFGGICDNHFYGDLHYIEIDTGEVVPVIVEGPSPCPRTSPIFFTNVAQDILYLWSGYTYDGSSNDLHEVVNVLDLSMPALQWQHFHDSFPGRSSASYCLHNDRHYIFGSTKSNGLLTFSEATSDFTTITCTGSEPQPDLNHTSMASVDEYIFLIGGEATFNYMHLFALDVKRKWWFAFHIRPDGESFATSDGIVNKLGLFMMPREYSTTFVYDTRRF